MPRAWNQKETLFQREIINQLYVVENKSIGEVARVLGIAYQTVFQRMKKLGIKSTPHLKSKYRNSRQNVMIPKKYSENLAEFIGIMFGDGSLSHFQVIVTLGNKEDGYVFYVCRLIDNIFNIKPKISTRARGYKDIYFGSVAVTEYLYNMGLVTNKVKSQVDIPSWIMKDSRYTRAFIRGFFDTDGSVYTLRFGNQISLCNHSVPILKSLHSMLLQLKYKPSSISSNAIYLTRRQDLKRFLQDIGSNHPKKFDRLKKAVLSQSVGTQVVNEGRL